MNSKKLITVILLLLILSVIPIQVFAAESATAEISFTVKNAPGTVVMEAVDDAPLPNRTVFEGVSAGKFEIAFSHPGEYCYKVYQKSGTEQDVTYDSTVYEVCIAVFVNENGTLYSVVAVNIENSSRKSEDIEFINTPAQSSVPTQPVEPTSPSEPTEPDTPTQTDSPTVPDKPNEPTTAGSNGTPPKTGDSNQLVLWILMMVLSVIGITVTSVSYKATSDRSKKRKLK